LSGPRRFLILFPFALYFTFQKLLDFSEINLLNLSGVLDQVIGLRSSSVTTQKPNALVKNWMVEHLEEE